MVNKLESLCDSCYYAEIKSVDGFKITKFREVQKCTRLSYFCECKCRVITNFIKVKECKYYRPKAGKIGKNLIQKTIFPDT